VHLSCPPPDSKQVRFSFVSGTGRVQHFCTLDDLTVYWIILPALPQAFRRGHHEYSRALLGALPAATCTAFFPTGDSGSYSFLEIAGGFVSFRSKIALTIRLEQQPARPFVPALPATNTPLYLRPERPDPNERPPCVFSPEIIRLLPSVVYELDFGVGGPSCCACGLKGPLSRELFKSASNRGDD